MDLKTKQYIKSDYFNYNGNRYYIGTRFKMNYKNMFVIAHFSGHNKNRIEIMIEKGLKNPTITSIDESEFYDMIIEILPVSYYDEMEINKEYVNDSNIPEIFIGWCLYIFVMVGVSIFNGRVFAWLLITIVFFMWRHNKKEEVGTYYKKNRSDYYNL